MKRLILFSVLTTFLVASHAQTGKTGTPGRKSTILARGTGQYHGSKDTTPGSPMGTGGAGGNEMSGSQKGSAAESSLQAAKTDQQTGDTIGSSETKTKKAVQRSKLGGSRNRKMR